MRRPERLLGAALSIAAGAVAAPLLLRVIWSWPYRVAIAGHSMEPTLQDGDWLLVDPDAYVLTSPRPGELVVVRDPRATDRLIVKRVAYVEDAGGLRVAGDHPAHAADAQGIGLVAGSTVVGRPWLRYWPPGRFGQVS